MNDMRLPGVSPFTSDSSTSQPGADSSRDAAQAFDAVMSRFAGERPRPQTPPLQDKAQERAQNKVRETVREPTRDRTQDNKAPAQAAPAKDKTAGANGSTQQNTNAGKGESATAGKSADGKPVARSKAAANDEPADGADGDAADVKTVAPTDQAALAGAAPVLVAVPGLAPAQNAALPVGGTPVTAGKEASAAGTRNSPLDVAPGETTAAGRTTGRPANDPRVAIGADAETPTGGTPASPRRAPVGAKDTLRFDAPLMRAMDPVQAEFAQRVVVATNALANPAGAGASAQAGQTDMTAQMLSAALAAGGSSPASGGTYSIAHTAINAPVGSPMFADELSQHVVMFAGQKVQRADIAVTPADLGPIAVSIEVRGQEATLAFAAASHTTRAAIEDALPRLRDMLAAQGLHLAGTHVGSEPRRDGYAPGRKDTGTPGARRASDAVNAVSAAEPPAIRRRVNLIDIEV